MIKLLIRTITPSFNNFTYDKSNNKHDEESARLYVMYGLSQFRTGDSIASEKSFKQAIRFCSLSGSGLGAFFWGWVLGTSPKFGGPPNIPQMTHKSKNMASLTRSSLMSLLLNTVLRRKRLPRCYDAKLLLSAPSH